MSSNRRSNRARSSTPQAVQRTARSEPQASEATKSGFTLLEVLAASLIMAMFYGVLSAKGVEGFVLEGDADRRLRASLVADRRLADLESLIVQGLPPALGSVEDDEDGFRIRVDVGPLELPLAALLPEEEAEQLGRRGAPPSLLAPPARGQAPPLRSVRVTVSWDDGLTEHAVQRTTFSLDLEATSAALTASGLGAGGESGAEAGGNATTSSAGGTDGAAAPSGPTSDPNRNRRIFRETE